MKVRIFSRGKGWYIPCNKEVFLNGAWVKDTEDKARLWVNFSQDNEPAYLPPQGQDWVFVDIYIEEGKFLSRDKKVSSLRVWKWHMEEPQGDLIEVEKQNREFAESIQGTAYAKNFGNPNLDISPDDLPFY